MGLRNVRGQALIVYSCSAVFFSAGCSGSGEIIGGTGGAFTTGGSSGGVKTATGGSSSSSTNSENSGGAQQQGGSSASATATRSSGGSKTGTGGTRNVETSGTGGAVQNSGGAKSSTGGASAVSGGSNTGGRTSVATGGTSTATSAGSGGHTVSTGGAGLGGNSDGTAGHSAALGGNGGSAGSSSLAATGGTTTSSSASGAAAIVPDPSWTCGMPNGIPVPSLGELALTVTLDIDKKYDVGATQFGNRKLYTVKSGKLEGQQVQATVLTGGMELELTLSTGSVELEEINVLKASDGTLIYMRTCGVAPAGDQEVRIVPDFEVATSSKLASLNTGKYAGTRSIDVAGGKIVLKIYDISKLTVAEPKVQIKDPASVTNQSWECSTATGGKGSTLFTESVTLGSSLSVGTSKNGNRNIIPITGGTVTGGTLLSSLSGSVVSAGADYQLIGGANAKLDARYALASKDGEVIVVRNCGPMGSLIPTFEARADGPYAVLNTNKYVSGDPAGATGGVSITFYERK